MLLSPGDRIHMEQMLDKHQRNRRLLESQAAEYTPANVPLHLLNGIASEQAAIARYESLLMGIPPRSTPSVPITPAGNTVFNQTGQQVGTQYNAAGNQTIHSTYQSGGINFGNAQIGSIGSISTNNQPVAPQPSSPVSKGSTMVNGDTFPMSGTVNGAILNSKNTLTNSMEPINGMDQAAPDQKQVLVQLLAQLQATLTSVPPEHQETAEAIAEMAKDLVEKSAKEKPNKTMLQITAEGLKIAAANLAAVLPTIGPLVRQITTGVQKLIGG